MREILFRGKRADNGEWAYGYYAHRPTAVCIGESNPSCIYVPACDPDDNSEFIEVIPETVGQYTGLTDKNGKRIFEGDIVSLVKHDSLIYKVVYVPCRYELVNSKGVNCFVLDIYKSENIEVIGNIHDNPELLGGENNGINR